MAELHSESARQSARIEGQQHLEELQQQGLLGIRRPVRVVASPCIAGSKPAEGAKVVHLVRHGQGFHNLLAEVYRDLGKEVDGTGRSEGGPYQRPEVMDPPLTAVGRRQAQALQPLTRKLASVGLVVVSPLCRATQTALLAFQHLLEPHVQPKVPFLGHAAVVERGGVNVCDKRRPLSEVRADFAAVDWSEIQDEEDPGWSDAVREPGRAVSDRAHAFMLWLRSRPEREVAVVTHSAFLFYLLNSAVECTEPSLAEWFLTGELRSMEITFIEENAEPVTKRIRTD